MQHVYFLKIKITGLQITERITIRNASDYDDMFIASKDDTKEQIENAKFVYTEINKYIGEISVR